MPSAYILGAGQTPRGRFPHTTQLRGEGNGGQVRPIPKLALAQNAGGFVEGDNAVAVVTILERTA
jgi:hypothetical protein